jgi:putative two-component system response regulator
MGFAFDVPEIEQVDVMVVDDERTSLNLLEAHLRRMGHPVRAFSSSRAALESIRENPPSILVTDMVMPEFTGVDLAHEARTRDPQCGVILVTGVGDQDAALATMVHGVSAYMAKPIEPDALRREVLRAYFKRAAEVHHRAMVNWAYETMDRNAQAMREVTLGTLTALINTLDARSPHFRGHSHAVAMQSAALAQALGLDDSEVEMVRVAGLLHDIGMIAVPDAIVAKPDALTPGEVDVIRQHCATGATIIEPMKHLSEAGRYILEHHERLDGSGYPGRKRGDQISLGGQIVGIAEAWAGILESRPYRGGLSRDDGFEILRRHKGEWFGEEVTEALVESDVGVMG